MVTLISFCEVATFTGFFCLDIWMKKITHQADTISTNLLLQRSQFFFNTLHSLKNKPTSWLNYLHVLGMPSTSVLCMPSLLLSHGNIIQITRNDKLSKFWRNTTCPLHTSAVVYYMKNIQITRNAFFEEPEQLRKPLVAPSFAKVRFARATMWHLN